MVRQPGVPDDGMHSSLADLVKAQHKVYGTVLNSTRQAAHTPPIALASTAMGRAIGRSGLIPRAIVSLTNLRVAAIVGCPL